MDTYISSDILVSIHISTIILHRLYYYQIRGYTSIYVIVWIIVYFCHIGTVQNHWMDISTDKIAKIYPYSVCPENKEGNKLFDRKQLP